MVFIKAKRESRHIRTQIRQINSSIDCAIKTQVAAQTIYMVAMVNMIKNNMKHLKKKQL